MRTKLVEDALHMAFAQRRPARGVIFHSDRGPLNIRARTSLLWPGQTASRCRSGPPVVPTTMP
jgi:transposase InsO family protein